MRLRLERITDEAAMPLQRAIDGVLEADVNEYLSAFPPDYVEIITEEYERSVCEDFTAYMQEYLSSALETHEVNLGGHTEIYFELQSKEALSDDQLDKYYDGYVDYNVIQYTPDTSAITGQYMIKELSSEAATKAARAPMPRFSSSNTTGNGICIP